MLGLTNAFDVLAKPVPKAVEASVTPTVRPRIIPPSRLLTKRPRLRIEF